MRQGPAVLLFAITVITSVQAQDVRPPGSPLYVVVEQRGGDTGEFIPTWVATLIVGTLGFAGVIWTQRVNAQLARDQFAAETTREKRRRQNMSRDVARAIAAELVAAGVALHSTADFIGSEVQGGKPINLASWAAITPASIEVYLAQLPHIGLLGELASETVLTYNEIQVSNQHDAMIFRQLNDGAPLIEVTEADIQERWRIRANDAEALAKRLKDFEPQDD